MSQRDPQIYDFGPFRLDADKRLLLREGSPVKLFPKEFATLLALVERNGELLEKDDLMRIVWGDTVVEESNLTSNISRLRRILGEKPNEHQYIVTVPGQGYRFVADVRPAFDGNLVREHTLVTNEHLDRGANNEIESGSRVYATSQQFAANLMTPPGVTTRLSSFGSFITRHRLTAAIVSTLFLGTVIGALFLFSPLTQKPRTSSASPPPFQKMEIRRITSSGKVKDAAISPDGKYVAYVLNDSGIQSLHLMHAETGSSVEIRPPEDVSYGWPVFSPDGAHLYYYVRKSDKRTVLCRSNMLGGVPTRILANFSGPVTLSPDGSRLAFMRTYSHGSAIIVVDAGDAGGKERLVEVRIPETFSADGMSWSPDGGVIAVGAASDYERSPMRICGVRLASGSVEPISEHQWSRVHRVAWLGDGSGLVLIGSRQDEGDRRQLWHVSYPSGEVRRITNDLHEYHERNLSVSTDSRSIVTVEEQTTSNIWLMSSGGSERPRQLTSGAVGRNGFTGISWLPNRSIVYSSYVDNNPSIWVIDSAGGTGRQLTPAGQTNDWPSGTPDGRYIVFRSNRSGGSEIWRMGADGSSPIRLTSGGVDTHPAVSPDGKWVVYASLQGDLRSLWKVPITGGTPTRLTDRNSSWPVVSPDGKMIACNYEGRIALIRFEGGQPVKTFSVPRTATVNNGLRWTPDGREIILRDMAQGIWRQPIAGGDPVQVFDLGTDKIFGLAWSPDGKQIAVSRGTQTYDVVLIRDFR